MCISIQLKRIHAFTSGRLNVEPYFYTWNISIFFKCLVLAFCGIDNIEITWDEIKGRMALAVRDGKIERLDVFLDRN